jgi:glutamine amidotransferase
MKGPEMKDKKSKKIIIVDYNLGNLYSVKHACEFVGLNAVITSDKNDLINADAAILPGVGAFGDAMNNLKTLDLINPIKDFISSGKPFMGICLGLQLLFSESEEFGNFGGLNIIEGEVKKFPVIKDNNRVKVPQIGWNKIYRDCSLKEWNDSPLEKIKNEEYMYFVHSFYVEPEDTSVKLTFTEYCNIKYTSSILCKNIFACQFHPEKSAHEGIKIYKRWLLGLK